MRWTRTALVLTVMLSGGRVAYGIDAWDAPTGHRDDNSGTDNELYHGSAQTHDLQAVGGTADQDWFIVALAPHSSYEVVADGLTEDVASLPSIEPVDLLAVDFVDDLGIVIEAAVSATANGGVRSQRVFNNGGAEVTNRYIRVRTGSNGCTTACTADAKYSIRMRETTLSGPRFNNSGTQVTVLILQNTTTSSVAYQAAFFNAAGAVLATSSGSMAARGALVLNTSSVPALVGQSGTLRVVHNAPDGRLVGKLVALEPSTGFSFDTPLLTRP